MQDPHPGERRSRNQERKLGPDQRFLPEMFLTSLEPLTLFHHKLSVFELTIEPQPH